MRIILVMAAVLAAAAATASASASLPEDPFAGLEGIVLAADEAAAIEGGDIGLELNETRDKIKVTVRYASTTPQGRPTTVQYSYSIDAHNNVADTKEADFMPAGGKTPDRLKGETGLKSKPEPFPEGTWKITAVKERKDKFGPNLMSTDAIGKVEVFDKKGKGKGKYEDEGYAIHSNTNDFDKSKSWGCIIVKQNDNENLARQIRTDMERKGRQTITVKERKEAEAPKVARKCGRDY